MKLIFFDSNFRPEKRKFFYGFKCLPVSHPVSGYKPWRRWLGKRAHPFKTIIACYETVIGAATPSAVTDPDGGGWGNVRIHLKPSSRVMKR